MKELVKKIRSKEYYTKLLDILVLNGLLEIIDTNEINYPLIVINVISFLNKNKKHYRNFSSDTFNKILILSIDEILNKKFNTDLDEEQISVILELVHTKYLIRKASNIIKDILIKIYYKVKCKSCITDSSVVITKDSEPNNI